MRPSPNFMGSSPQMAHRISVACSMSASLAMLDAMVGPFDKAVYISTKANQREQLEATGDVWPSGVWREDPPPITANALDCLYPTLGNRDLEFCQSDFFHMQMPVIADRHR